MPESGDSGKRKERKHKVHADTSVISAVDNCSLSLSLSLCVCVCVCVCVSCVVVHVLAARTTDAEPQRVRFGGNLTQRCTGEV